MLEDIARFSVINNMMVSIFVDIIVDIFVVIVVDFSH